MLSTILILFAISLPFMTSASAIYMPYAIPTASVFLSPPRISGTSGTTVTVNLNISNILGLSTFGAGLTFNHHTAQCTGVTQGTFMSQNGKYPTLFLAGYIDNNLGNVGQSAEAEWLTTTVNGSGTLISFQFKMNGTGTSYSDLHIIYFEAIAYDSSLIPCKTIDYFTTSLGRIVQIVGNPQGGTGRNPYPGFNYQSFATINQVIGSNTYHGNMSFVISSPDFPGSAGFFSVTIPNALMNCTSPDQWYVTLNGVVQALRSILTNSTYTVVSLDFTYSSSTIEAIQILSTNAAGPRPVRSTGGVVGITGYKLVFKETMNNSLGVPATIDYYWSFGIDKWNGAQWVASDISGSSTPVVGYAIPAGTVDLPYYTYLLPMSGPNAVTWGDWLRINYTFHWTYSSTDYSTDYTAKLHVHPADIAGAASVTFPWLGADGTVGTADLRVLGVEWGLSSVGADSTSDLARADINGDRSVGIADLHILGVEWGQTWTNTPPP